MWASWKRGGAGKPQEGSATSSLTGSSSSSSSGGPLRLVVPHVLRVLLKLLGPADPHVRVAVLQGVLEVLDSEEANMVTFLKVRAGGGGFVVPLRAMGTRD